MTEYLQLINVILIPIFIWIVRVEKKLTRIETKLEIHNPGKGKKDVGKDIN